MAFARPVHAGVPLLFSHAFSPLQTASRRNLRRSLYWRSESKVQFRRGLPTGHRLRPVWQAARPILAIGSQGSFGRSAKPARFAKATLIGPPPRKPHSATLRCAACGAFDEPPTKGTGFVSQKKKS